MKVWKRCLAAVLAFMIFTTSVNFSEAAGTYDTENFIWTANDAEVVADYYGLSEEAEDVLLNNAIDGGYEYELSAPYDNGTEGKKDLVAVDYVNKFVYAKALHTGGVSWLPVQAVLNVDGEEKETINLATGISYYDEVEYYAAGAFEYSGNSYNVNVIYQLQVDISEEEQKRILEIPQILAQTAQNLEDNLDGVYEDVKNLGDMTPYLAQLLTFEFMKEETVTNEETGESESVETREPAFDPAEDADVIAAIEALYKEYTENNGLILYNTSEEYRNSGGKNILSYTFEKGGQVIEQSAGLYEHVWILRDSTRLKNVVSNLKQESPELYEELENLQKTLRNMVGTSSKPGELTALQDVENWIILDEEVQARIFADSYSDEDFTALESAVYTLRNYEEDMPEVSAETLLAAEIGVSCDITFYNIIVTVSGETTSGELEDTELYPLESVTSTIKLLEGSDKDEIRQAIEEAGIEKFTLSAWNAIDSEYQVNTSNYDREESGIPKELKNDIECKISYSPKTYRLKTNFGKSANVPYGYLMELPKSDDEEISYDYVVETETGSKVSYNEGVTYKVTQSVTITQTEGTEKTEYRLYDFLASDVQYSMSDEAKQILLSSALESPTLKIRVPDGSTVGEVVLEDGIYYVEAEEFGAGILGMTWEPYIASVMDGDTVLEDVAFSDGVAKWTMGGFTHVKVSYRLKIEKVKDGILNRDLDEEDVLYALNLPHDLVTQTVKQNQLLNGDEGVTAKVMYKEMSAVNNLMDPTILSVIGGSMQTDAGKDAVLRLQGSEDKIIKGQNGQSLGYGAWNTANNELALYTYLRLCEDTDWSLAAYYKQGLYEKVAEQSAIVAECLEAITADPGFEKLMSNSLFSSYKDKVDKINVLLPKLKELSVSIEGPHQAINMEDEGYEELIELLLTMEGKTSAADTSDGIYAYTSIRRNGNEGGSLTVSVQVGTKLAQTREISYLMEDGSHVLTEAEAAKILEYIAELESAGGMTEDEKQYYTLVSTGIPKAGDIVKKNEVVSLTYLPKEYTVTIKGVSPDEYEQKFKYKSDYVITLPAYSDDEDTKSYYCYWIDEETQVKVANGSVGYYTFTKEDLTTRFANEHFEIYKREEIEMLPQVEVTAEVTLNENTIRGYKVDTENTTIYLDADPSGLKLTQFNELIDFTYGDDLEAETEIENSNRDPARQNYLANGSTVSCTAYDDNGDPHVITYEIVIMGDINKNGKVDSNDALIIAKNYLGTAGETEKIQDSVSKIAADMNGNGIYMDSNDALQIMKKCTNWYVISSDKKYESVLAK